MRLKPLPFAIGIHLLVIVGLTNSTIAQNKVQYLPDKVGVWKPFRMSCDGSGHGLTAAQNRIYSAKLLKLSEAIHQSQVFNPPMGIQAWPTGCVNATIEFLDDYPGNRTGPIPGYLMVGTFSYAYYAGTAKAVVADEGPHFFVDVNSLVRVYSNSADVAQDDRGQIFMAPEVARTVSGFPLYKNGSIVITKIPRPVFLPVGAGSFLQARIRQAQTELARAQAEHNQRSSEYGRWLANREKHQQERERSYQQLLAVNPKGAADFLRITEESERKQEERLKADAASAGTPSEAEQFKQKELDGYQAELNSLSPEQRNQQAYYTLDRRPGDRLLAASSQHGAQPLVRLNPVFFDRSRPRTDFQSLVVGRLYDKGLRERSYDPQYLRVIEFRKTFDFQSLLPLLD